MAHRNNGKCYHVWILYPAGSYDADFDHLIRLDNCFNSRQAAHYHIGRLRQHWEELPNTKVRVMEVLACRGECPCGSEVEEEVELTEVA